MLSIKTIAALLFTGLTTVACGGGSEGDSEGNQASSSLGKFAGLWKQKNFCIGPHTQQHTDSFARGKYATIILKNSVTSTDTLNVQLYKLWFNNPACTGVGERSPNETPGSVTEYCVKHIESTTVSGASYERVGRCELINATSLERIHNGELEISGDNERATPTLVYVKYL